MTCACRPADGIDYWTGRRAGTRTRDRRRADPVGDAGNRRRAGERPTSSPLTPQLAELPVFVRAGTILPRQPLVQSTAEQPKGPLRLDVYPGADCSGELYDDDGHSMAFTRGGFFRQTVRCTVTPEGMSIDFAPAEGRYAPWWTAIAVTVHGWSGPAVVRRGGGDVASRVDAAASALAFDVAGSHDAAHIAITRR